MRLAALFVLGAGALGLAACGGGGGGGGGAGSCTPTQTATLTVTDIGFSNGTNNACVQLGGQVTFANTGASAHNIVFDTPGCPATVPIAANSQSAPVSFPQTVVNCNFHLDGNTALTGTVAVTSTTVSGGGY